MAESRLSRNSPPLRSGVTDTGAGITWVMRDCWAAVGDGAAEDGAPRPSRAMPLIASTVRDLDAGNLDTCPPEVGSPRYRPRVVQTTTRQPLSAPAVAPDTSLRCTIRK